MNHRIRPKKDFVIGPDGVAFLGRQSEGPASIHTTIPLTDPFYNTLTDPFSTPFSLTPFWLIGFDWLRQARRFFLNRAVLCARPPAGHASEIQQCNGKDYADQGGGG